jgi:hypothetical protein
VDVDASGNDRLYISSEAKQIGGSLNLKKLYPSVDSLNVLSVSCDGNKISITARKVFLL